MKYKVNFRLEAQDDVFDAIDWYEKRRVGLGDELFIAIENETYRRIFRSIETKSD